ncbi:hypothetical protein [Clavibacter michiganensis]|uniref:hypothetical protein n=1 Tax=Clavibacter michiganensis TaxID=28447 RepID=UPI003EC02F00
MGQITGRPCTICTSPLRQDIEGALVEGDRVSRVALAFGVGPDAIRRHLVKHVSPQVLDAMREVEGLNPSTIVGRLQELVDAARDARDVATDRGNIAAALRAGDAELRALVVLADRFGVTSDSVAQDLSSAGDFAQTIGRVSSQSLEAGHLLADALEQVGHRVYADELRKSISQNKGLTS